MFLLGVVQHQVADVSWHSLGVDQGFLQTMGQVRDIIIIIIIIIIISIIIISVDRVVLLLRFTTRSASVARWYCF